MGIFSGVKDKIQSKISKEQIVANLGEVSSKIHEGVDKIQSKIPKDQIVAQVSELSSKIYDGVDMIQSKIPKDQIVASLNEVSSKMQTQLTAHMITMFDSVREEREEYYDKHPREIPSDGDVDGIIKRYAKKNAIISGGINVIPGPYGMLAVVPELVMTIKNQIKMIYDIGVACGKRDLLNKELLAVVFASALGTATIGLAAMHGSKVFIKRASLQVFQKIVTILAGNVTQKALKSLVSKWLPIIGAVAMAAWSKYSTEQTGKKTREMLSKEIVIDDSEGEIDEINEETVELLTEGAVDSVGLQMLRIQSLINLAKIDNRLDEKEFEYLKHMIGNAPRYCQVNCVNFFMTGKLGRTFPILLCCQAISILRDIKARSR